MREGKHSCGRLLCQLRRGMQSYQPGSQRKQPQIMFGSYNAGLKIKGAFNVSRLNYTQGDAKMNFSPRQAREQLKAGGFSGREKGGKRVRKWNENGTERARKERKMKRERARNGAGTGHKGGRGEADAAFISLLNSLAGGRRKLIRDAGRHSLPRRGTEAGAFGKRGGGSRKRAGGKR